MFTHKLRHFLFSILLLVLSPTAAYACNDQARAVASQEPNSVLLSVRSAKGTNGGQVCVIKLKIKSINGQPERIVTRTVKK